MKTEQELVQDRNKKTGNMRRYYQLNEEQVTESREALTKQDFGAYNVVKPEIIQAFNEICKVGIISDSELDAAGGVREYVGIQVGKEIHSDIPLDEVYTVDNIRSILIHSDPLVNDEKAEGARRLHAALARVNHNVNVDSIYDAWNLKSIFKPNLTYDPQITDQMYRKEIDNISTTLNYHSQGQLIVSKNSIVTEEIQNLLDSYKAEYDATIGYEGDIVYLWLANILISLALVVALFLGICFCNHKVFDQFNKYIYILVIFLLPILVTSLTLSRGESASYVIPYTLVALFLYSFFQPRMVLTVYMISLVPVLFLASNGVELYVMHLLAGMICMLVFERFSSGWLQFISALIAFFVMVLVWLAFRMLEGMDNLHDYTVVFNMALGALLLVAAYPLTFLFEKIFRLVSKSKLVELTDTNNKLLRVLADKAPGTFQHCLQVMNLADAAARSIDANVPLIRAGALYHDIGKIANPHCFTENSTTDVNYHAELSPKESAQDIIRHVADGLILAEKHNLPQILKDFIITHHGTTKAGYFYTKFVNDGGNPDDVDDFTYNGVKPETKEQGILMLCDAIEAASRSLKGYSPENISALVNRIFDEKIQDGQLSESNLSLREMNIIKEEIKTYLVQMYHSRVAYPKRKK